MEIMNYLNFLLLDLLDTQWELCVNLDDLVPGIPELGSTVSCQTILILIVMGSFWISSFLTFSNVVPYY